MCFGHLFSRPLTFKNALLSTCDISAHQELSKELRKRLTAARTPHRHKLARERQHTQPIRSGIASTHPCPYRTQEGTRNKKRGVMLGCGNESDRTDNRPRPARSTGILPFCSNGLSRSAPIEAHHTPWAEGLQVSFNLFTPLCGGDRLSWPFTQSIR